MRVCTYIGTTHLRVSYYILCTSKHIIILCCSVHNIIIPVHITCIHIIVNRIQRVRQFNISYGRINVYNIMYIYDGGE